MMAIKAQIKRWLPQPILRSIANRRLGRDMQRSCGKTRAEIFSEIYAKRLWGSRAAEYCSGAGSSDDIIAPYAQLIRSLIQREQISRVVDLGCGDFQVGRLLLSPEVSYIGCDVCADIVHHNTQRFSNDQTSFVELDIVNGPLPDGELCLVRQVFQHLPNRDILTVLHKSTKYRLLVITDEQLQNDNAGENADILPYHGTRRVFGQGLKLERAPFHLQVETVLEQTAGGDYGAQTGTWLRTVLIRNG
jgi:SAM-dependent methyltransferase